MASSGNQNQPSPPQTQQSGPPFDMHKLFRPSSPNPMPSPTTGNLYTSPSYPPPTGPFPFHPHYLPYQPQQSPELLHQNHYQLQQPQLAPNLNHQRPISNPNLGGARLMALLSTQNPQSSSNLDVPQPSLSFPLSSPSPTSSGASEFLMPVNPINLSAIPSAPPVNLASPQPSPTRMLSTKVPKGRHLIGEHVVYDISVRLQGEVQPQLEVTPITKYTSDPGLVLGRQIAVNRTYICYGLKMGNVRVLNINTALRSLLRGHTQRVTDMAFFAEDVHLLASASVDGRVFIWKIDEGPDEESKPQISGKAVLALQILGDWESVHPRLCWHPHKQEILMVAIGNCILKIDTTRVGKGGGFSAEEPLKCSIEKLIDGIQIVGKHNGEVTELSMCQWMTSRLASASLDGTVMIWEDRKASPVATLQPHNGNPVNSVTFLTAPYRPDHIVLITAGLLNREVKIWTSASEEGWLLPGDAESWLCTQALELKSSSETRVEDVFFNQVVALPRTGLFLLANAKKNAIYAVHIDYGNCPAATRMDYISEFTVTMPILSLTGTSDSLPDGEHIVQVYCVQTQAIQQYALDLSQCLPPSLANMELEKPESNVSRAFEAVNSDGSITPELSHGGKPEMPIGNSTSMLHTLSSSSESIPVASLPLSLASSDVSSLPEIATSGMETKPSTTPSQNTAENFHTASPPLPLSPRLSGFGSPSNSYNPCSPLTNSDSDQPVLNYSVEQRTDTVKENLSDVPSSGDNLRLGDKIGTQNDKSMVPNPLSMFKHPTHLVTPSEILSTAASSSEISSGINVGEAKVQDVVNNDAESIKLEVKVLGEAGTIQNNELGCQKSHIVVAEKKEKSFYSQASDLGIQMARDCFVETHTAEGIQQNNDVSLTNAQGRPVDEEEVQDATKDMTTKAGESETVLEVPQSPVPTTKGKRQKGKNSQVSGTPPSPSALNSTDSCNEPSSSSCAPSSDAAMSHLLAMQETLEQLMSSQKELQKQMTVMVSVPVTKEGRRLEASLGRNMEKVFKAHTDALWARFQEENTRHEKFERERTQQVTNLINNFANKDLPTMLEKTLKKELASVGPAVARSVTPILEKTISSAVTESFQKGVGEKAVNQLEKSVSSKLEATVARQIQTQFQTSGKQALQDALRSTLEASIIPAFEMSCKSMFEQVDAAFEKGLVKHTAAAQQQFESTHSPLAIALRDAINSASSITQTLSGELADNQQKLLAIVAAGANATAGNPMVTQLSNGPLAALQEMAEVPLDPTKELSRLIADSKFEEAFTGALHRSDVSIVSWLCSQVDLQGILSTVPLPLSQGVLLALLQQLACDITKETNRKVAWMSYVAIAINPSDHRITMHVRPIFEQVYQILGHQLNLPITSASEANNIRLLMHVINSMLMGGK